ncbi:xanthine dehydrogenase [Leptopilina boulardi]|uniref:xanthine dehydrogenase n=1 Tax=Leptopilina boulardi TaxID=63433 RepID=UPI0021F56160|nr:xanthine dehydrogenase [Leptopilina boulardi]XP_051167237.1 xanthine dehydrogenase [Leptopilina boulardi]XP_051167238.1 xanthine dehydrogenase [Leptopilina boulardi]
MDNQLKRSESKADKSVILNGMHETTMDIDGFNCPKLSKTLVFYVNGVEVRDTSVEPEWTLLYYLRNKLGLCGTKLGCAEGGCGACTVMISKFNRVTEKPIHYAANACLTPVCAVHGLSITTVEGIGSIKTKLHPVQERIAKAHGSQCGFCTPGIVMSMYTLLRSMPKPQIKDLEIAFQGNLCRCTGYRAIIEGYKTFTEEWEKVQRLPQQNGNVNGNVCAMGENCCKRVFTSEPNELFDSKAFRPYDPTQEPIFPPKLQISSKFDEEYLILKGRNITWYRPLNLNEILTLKKRFPNAKIIVGNTEVGVEMKFRNILYPVLIQPTKIKEMCEIIESKEYLQVGASVTLIEMEDKLREEIKIKPEFRTRIFAAIVEMLHWFAGKQIRNVAAVGGNIMTGSPISDLNPIFMAAGIKLNLCSLDNGFRSVKMDHTFFTGYRKNVVAADEILVSISIPFSLENQFFVAYKQSKRRDDDIAIVNMALNVFLESDISIKKIHIAFGGLAPTTVLATKTCEKLIGQKWNLKTLEMVHDDLDKEFPLSGNAPGGMILYRRSLTLSLFFKGFIHVIKLLSKNPHFCDKNLKTLQIPKEWDSIPEGFHYKMPCSSQYYQVAPEDQRSTDLIGRPVVHVSALKQATGEALYCDDVPKINGELYLAFVLSTQAHANIVKIDTSKALEMEGVIAFFDGNDAPNNKTGPIFHDEEVFYGKKVTSQGQVIGVIVAVDQLIAQRAAKSVKIDYQVLTPIVSIEDAILKKSFFTGFPISLTRGDSDKAFAEADHVLTGEARMGGQEHFYLETNACIAIPKEEDEIELICSTQHPAEIQKAVAELMYLPMNKVIIRAKRLGGGFGGKESRAAVVALPVSLAAYKLRKPVRCMLDRDEDMMMSGTRHPFLHKYKVAFNKEGKIQALEIEIYANGGYSMDLSRGVIERAMFHCENAYNIPNTKIIGYICKTNLPSNTAFRGFGGPQGMFAAENIIREIAKFLNRDPIQIAEINLYKEGDITPYNQTLSYCTMERCWQECLNKSNFKKRQTDIRRYNKEHRFKKRGISILPTKFGIAFTVQFLNQGGSLVHVYHDGSVMIAHGGVEMGQGLHTKMIQVASRIFKVNPTKIHIPDTATDKVPNSSPTAASASSDLYGMAVLKACTEIMNRIQPIIDKNPKGTWEEWIKEAYLQRIGLSATGFYKTPDIGYCFETNSGIAFDYFTYGVACSEVEIDCLTGDHQLLRTDIVMDLGESLNPAIDIGQVEGGFIQGYGLYTMEELMYSPTGTLMSRGPGAYKIPGFSDIPQEFNVSLLKGAPNPRAVYSSKAVGEPPLFLACSAFFAIKEAIKSAREDMNIKGIFKLEAPATAARIRMACVDELTLKVGEGDGKPAWNLVP